MCTVTVRQMPDAHDGRLLTVEVLLSCFVMCAKGSVAAGRVLTMERLHGAPLTDLAAIRSVTAQDPERILINALNTWFGSVLACPSFHADVHAGAPAFLFTSG